MLYSSQYDIKSHMMLICLISSDTNFDLGYVYEFLHYKVTVFYLCSKLFCEGEALRLCKYTIPQ